jgi:protein O-GlcNAc transferase
MGKPALRGKATRRSAGPGAARALEAIESHARAAASRGDVDAAATGYARAVTEGSRSPDVFNDLGVLLAKKGQFPAAVVQLETALLLAPAHPNARANLLKALESMAMAAFQQGRWSDAAVGFTRLAALDPTCAIFHGNLAAAWRQQRRPDQALPHLQRARDLEPDNARIRFQLGSVLLELGHPECEAELARAIELDPHQVDARVNLAIVHSRRGQLARAGALLREALERAPDHIEAHSNLASLLREQGEIGPSREHTRRALALCPGSPSLFSNYLLSRLADPATAPAETAAEHARWAARFAAPVDPGTTNHFPGFPRDPERRLRVGYVSPDLRSHSVATFLEPLLAAHDRRQTEVFCYSDGIPDAVTARLRALADRWCDARGLDDEALAARVAQDQIDVLVDLAGHTAGNRLLCFARRPAPVQVSYCGYPHVTGLAAMTWRLTDAVADPEGASDATAGEQLWRLPHGFLCFQPDAAAPLPAPAPVRERGFVTFGSFNNLSKLNDDVLDLWAEILRAVPDARLLLKARALSDESPRARLRARFSARGIDPARVEVAPYAATPAEHLDLYRAVDVGLDPFPYNGTTTTCEALWMGVPVVTLRGRVHAGRVGASLLTRVGLPTLIADTGADYVRVAAGLAGDHDALAAIRRGLRARFAASDLASPAIITGDIEAAYRGMWRAWCADHPV